MAAVGPYRLDARGRGYKMPKIDEVTLNITFLEDGGKAQATVKYGLSFSQAELDAGVQYEEFCHLITSDRNDDDWFQADPKDLGAPPLKKETVTASENPEKRNLKSKPFDANLIYVEDDLGRDEIRARVQFKPTSKFEDFKKRSKASKVFYVGQ
jgi:hypothetical protein